MTALTVRSVPRDELDAVIGTIAELRMTVFRQWPYLYDGDADYEQDYLKTYLDAPDAFVAGAYADDGTMVGACTAAPLVQHDHAFIAPLSQTGHDPDSLFYFGESVLLPHCRGRGIGVRFFEVREAEARRLGFYQCIFSAVLRPADHPLKPAGAKPLDGFWRNRGYQPMPGIRTGFSWRDVGEDHETEKPMVFWHKVLV